MTFIWELHFQRFGVIACAAKTVALCVVWVDGVNNASLFLVAKFPQEENLI